MKKLLFTLILTMSLLILFCLNAVADNISVYVDNEQVQLTDAMGANVYPFIQNGTTYVPLRGISETLDCDVVWDGNNKTILIYKEMQSDNSAFINNSDEIKLYVDNQLVELKDANGTIVKPFIKGGTTYVPLRGVSQVLGCWVRWNGQTKTVSIYMNKVPPEGVGLSENKPYETNMFTAYYVKQGFYYGDEGKYIEKNSIQYTNAIQFPWEPDTYVLFNLNGKFKKVTFDIGCDNSEVTVLDSTISFIVDGQEIEVIECGVDIPVKSYSIDLDYGLQLKIVSSGKQNFLGNIIFWGE